MTEIDSFLKNKHILAVDDELDVLETIQEILEEAKIDVAQDYETASKKILETLHADPLGKDAAIIGGITEKNKGKVLLKTNIGGKRVIDMLTGSQLPRIC